MPHKSPKGMGNFIMMEDDRTNKEFLRDFFDEKMMHEILMVNGLYHYAGLILQDEELTAWLDKQPFCFFINKADYLKAAKTFRDQYDAKYNQ